jgi:hypothetical protein
VHLLEVVSQLKISFHATAIMLITLIHGDFGYSLPDQQARVNVGNLGRGYIAARTDTTQQSGQTPDTEAEMKNITVPVSGYTKTSDSRGR